VGDDPWTQKVERFGRGVAVRNEGAQETGFLRLLKDGHGPLGGDERFVVAGNDEARVRFAGGIHQLFRRDFLDRRDRRLIAQRLAGDPVLAVGTMEIAAHHAEGQRVAARMNVEERLLLHRVALQRGHVTERHAQPAALMETNFAYAATPLADQTAMPARETADAIALHFPERTDRGVAI